MPKFCGENPRKTPGKLRDAIAHADNARAVLLAGVPCAPGAPNRGRSPPSWLLTVSVSVEAIDWKIHHWRPPKESLIGAVWFCPREFSEYQMWIFLNVFFILFFQLCNYNSWGLNILKEKFFVNDVIIGYEKTPLLVTGSLQKLCWVFTQFINWLLFRLFWISRKISNFHIFLILWSFVRILMWHLKYRTLIFIAIWMYFNHIVIEIFRTDSFYNKNT